MGPGGVALNSTFQNRDTPQYKSELGLAIASLAGTCPDGLLVFFPSYGVLQSCLDYWKSNSGSGALLMDHTHRGVMAACIGSLRCRSHHAP